MSIRDIRNKYLTLVSNLNSKGLPIPLIRDPKTRRGDVALTLVFISSVWLQIGIVGKWSGKFGGIDTAQAFEFFITACSLYWARKLSPDSKLEAPDPKEDVKPDSPDDPDGK